MQRNQLISFGPYQLDVTNAQLRLDHKLLPLTNKAFEVLCSLVAQAGQLVTKEMLLQAMWADTVVTETALTNCISELRQVLRDNAKKPRFIETVHRRGYRFIAPLTTPLSSSLESSVPRLKSERHKAAPSLQTLDPRRQTLDAPLVGREAELARLHELFAQALKGERQLVFVTGEAGIGKTALVDAFLQTLDPKRWTLDARPWLTSGQCIEQYGAGEAYLPVLEALGRLGRQPDGAQLLTILDQYAPTWLVQLPALLSPAELEAVQRRSQGSTHERMLRELTEAIETLTAEQPLVVVLEDLHWSDPSTVELLAMLARRRESARLFIVGTYRAAELAVMNHPLKTVKQELVARGQATEIALTFLSPAAVREYVGQRVTASESADSLAEVVYRRTDGQPLFMVQVTDYLVQRDRSMAQSADDLRAVEQTLPQGLRELIEAQLGRLTGDEQGVLTVGSVSGPEFTVASTAAGLGREESAIEELCERLARRGQFIEEREVKTWPDGTVSGSYGFRHALYQEVVYTRIPTVRRLRLHKTIGERIEGGYGERASEAAAELAVHFERGHDKDRAVFYLQKAGETALQRHAYLEALGHFQKGVEFLRTLPETADRTRRELALQFLLIQAIVAVKGHASVEVERAYLRAQTLCEQVGGAQQLFFVLLGLFRLRHGHCEYQHARELSAQCLALAQRTQDPALFFPAYYALGTSELYLGNVEAAEVYFRQAIRRHDTRHDATYVSLYGNASPYAPCLGYAAAALWFLGYPDQALQGAAEMLTIAKEFTTPFTLAATKSFASFVYHCCRQGAVVQEQGEEGIAVATRMGFPFWRALCLVWRGWGLAAQGHYEEGIEQMHQGLAAQRATGSSVHRVHFTVLLAEAYGHAGQWEEGLRLLAEAEADMDKTDERFYEAELWRIKGELLLKVERGEGG